ncbi:MAG: M48 family metallopeptidase [Actinobacteria bacterium]|nr:M48 family metallopeptidase [Actinomycetota bacterium]
MSANTILNIALAIMVASSLFDAVLNRLNLKHSETPIDHKFSFLYDDEKRKNALDYQRANYKANFLADSISTVITILMLALGGFGIVDDFVRGYFSNEILIGLGFIAIVGLLGSIISLPFTIYSTFVIEAKFGFNKTTVKTFITDKIKGTLIGAIIGAPLFSAIVWIYLQLGSYFWLATWLLMTAFSLFSFAFGTTLILPRFNKLSPLEDGELRTAILDYCKSQGYSVGRLFVMDGSRRSTKANAFFAGIGKSKTIVLYDTLIEKLNIEEVVAVLAHEVGHYKRKHTLAMFVSSILQTLAITALLGWMLNYPEISYALGANVPSFHVAATTFFLLFTPISMILGLANMAISRRNEFDADEYSTSTYPKGVLASALGKISTDALANLNPHPLYVKVHYTHPPVIERLKALQ